MTTYPIKKKRMCKRIVILLFFASSFLLQAQTDLFYGIVSKGGVKVLPIKYDNVKDGGVLQRVGWSTYKYALLDSIGTILTPHLYDDVEYRSDVAFYRVKEKQKWGVINSKCDTIVIPFEYDAMESYNVENLKGYLVGKGFGGDWKRGVIDIHGRLIIPVEYDDVESERFGFIKTKLAKKEGLYTSSGKEILPPIYGYIYVGWERFMNGACRIAIGDSPGAKMKSGLWDQEGNELTPPIYDSFSKEYTTEKEWVACIKKENKMALINQDAKIVTPFIYDKIELSQADFFENEVHKTRIVILAEKDNLYYLLDKSGKVLLESKLSIYNDDIGYLFIWIEGNKRQLFDYTGKPLLREEVYSKSSIRRIVDDDSGMEGALDPENNLAIPYMYKNIDSFSFSEKYTGASKKGLLSSKYGVIDIDNNVIIPFKYTFSKVIANSRCLLGDKGELFFSDIQGNPIDNNRYDDYQFGSSSYPTYKMLKGKKMGVCDTLGYPFLPCEYDDIYSGCMKLSDGKFILEKDKKLGLYDFINKKHLTPIEYDEIACQGEWSGLGGEITYIDYCLVVSKGNKKGLLTVDGTKITSCLYDEIKFFCKYSTKEKLYVTTKKEKLGLINSQGIEITPCVYTKFEDLKNGMILAYKDGFYGVINTEGAEVIPFQYDVINHIVIPLTYLL